MFVLEFEKPSLEAADERPHRDLLLALPPTFSSSMMYHLFFTHSMVVENLIARNWVVYIFVLLRILFKGDFNFPVSILRFILFLLILYFCLAHWQMYSQR
jgi:hypothetical protein